MTGSLFSVVLAFGTGCAVTNYALITDNDQLRAGQKSNVVNTNGQAHFGKGIVTFWPDGTDENLNFVDQKPNGDRTLTTYNNFSSGSHPTFHDDLYCNPDWNGCSIFTAPDPEVGDESPFDGTFNRNCSGARSLSILLSTGRYYGGECGRGETPLGFKDRLALLGMGRVTETYGAPGLLFNANISNLQITLDNNAGVTESLPLVGDLRVAYNGSVNRPQSILDATNPLLRASWMRYAGFLDRWGTSSTTVTVEYNGIARQFLIAGNTGVSRADRVREVVNRRY